MNNQLKKLLMICFLIGITAVVFAGCAKSGDSSDSDSNKDQSISSENVNAEFQDAYDEFAFQLFQKCSDKNENIMISPLSIMNVLAMTANGAENETLTQMSQVLYGDKTVDHMNQELSTWSNSLPNTENTAVNQANSMWIREAENRKIKDSFLQKNKEFSSDIYTVAFDDNTKDEINSWVSEKTNGNIKDAIKQIDKDSLLYLVNATTFDAEWEEMYSDERVLTAEFTKDDGTTQNVSMMYSLEKRYIQDENTVGFVKKYKDGYSFIALLPSESVQLNEYKKSLDSAKWKSLLENASDTSVEAAIPQFSFEYEGKLKDALAELGMSAAFDPETADFSGIVEDESFCISELLHKTYISVNEQGTKAGSVTIESTSGSASDANNTKKVYLNRPFIFAIVEDQTDLPIFIGTFSSPN
jgi:serpin B